MCACACVWVRARASVHVCACARARVCVGTRARVCVYDNFIKSSHVHHWYDRVQQQALHRGPKFLAVSPFGNVGDICCGLFSGMIIS